MNYLHALTILLLMSDFNGCTDKTDNTIAFSCIACKACVVEALNFIDQNNLDLEMEIVLDSNCVTGIFPLNSVKFTHLPQDEIFKKYGRFGNFVLFDNKGRKTIFTTDMKLENFISR